MYDIPKIYINTFLSETLQNLHYLTIIDIISIKRKFYVKNCLINPKILVVNHSHANIESLPNLPYHQHATN